MSLPVLQRKTLGVPSGSKGQRNGPNFLISRNKHMASLWSEVAFQRIPKIHLSHVTLVVVRALSGH